MLKPSEKTKDLKQSGIRAASVECAKIGGINLGQSVCDLPVPATIKQAAILLEYVMLLKRKKLR